MTFHELRLSEPIVRAVSQEGYTNPTAIQAKAIPAAIKGSDLLGYAQTGTGKTAALRFPSCIDWQRTPASTPSGIPPDRERWSCARHASWRRRSSRVSSRTGAT